uniref:Chemokine interleukin-8-like domain-containing protein n=1 Tax=Oreochromis niloticus TaxID=8128 RepID=A0A669BBP0_ORENI
IVMFIDIITVASQINQFLTSYLSDSARPGKKGPCCVDVTKNDMSPEVVGQTYDEQAARPPCVKAILLNTKKGQLCADPDAQWKLFCHLIDLQQILSGLV